MLLISKPIRQGDVIAFEKNFGGASWGWATQMGLNYALSWNMVTVRSIYNCESGSMIPKMGLTMSRTRFFLAVWDSFHANGIEIAFPQRDLHIKSAVPLKISKDNGQPVAKDASEFNQ